MNSKGQVSIFIILGTVLLLLTVVFLSTGDLASNKAAYEVTEKVDEQFIAVQKFVQNCLDTTARTGLEKLGSQGGYIDPVAMGLLVNYPSSKQPASAFKFLEGSNLVVPYWYYLSSQMDCSGNCYFDSKAPDLEGTSPRSIQSQLQNYVDENLDECLDDFASVEELGYIVNVTDDKKTSVIIRDNDVRFYLDYPLEVTRSGTSQKITQYVADQAVPLRPMYDYAAIITAAQIQHTFLEKQAISVISFNSGPSTKLLPPSTATTYEYISTVFWLKSWVKQKLQELLSQYVQGLQVANSKNFVVREYDPDDVSPYARAAIQRVYDNMILPINITPEYDEFKINNRFDVAFDYLSQWPIYFDVNSDGEIIRPHSLSVSDITFGMQQYDTYYDISYPVRVAIRDYEAYNGDGFVFAFGLQSNIRGSAPLNESYDLLSGEGNNVGTFLCNPTQFNSGESQILVIDNRTLQPVNDVSLSFTCGEETCNIGSTDGTGKWGGKLPICAGAMLTLYKDDKYAQRALQVSTNLDESSDIGTVTLEPYRVLNASVEKKLIKKNVVNGEWVFSDVATSLSSKEFAIVSYKQINEAFGTDPVQGAFMYYGGVGFTEETQVKLVPGIYEVSVQSILNEPLVIPKEDKSIRVLFKKIKFTIPEIRMDQFPSGSLSFNESIGYWYVGEDDLDSGIDAVTFYTLSPDIPSIPVNQRVVADLKIMNDVNNYIYDNYDALLPEFGLSDASFIPSGGSSFISMASLNLGYVVPGSFAEFSVSVIGNQQIKNVEVTQPTASPVQSFVGSTLQVRIPSDAFGPTQIAVIFTFTDGSTVTKTTTVNVRSLSVLDSISASIAGVSEQSSYEFSNATVRNAQLQVIANFADGSTHDVTETEFGTSYQTTNDSVVDLGSDGKLLFYEAGESVITVEFEGKPLDIQITITE